MSSKALLGVSFVAVALGAGWLLLPHAPKTAPAARTFHSPAATSAAVERSGADKVYASKPAEAEREYRAFVDAHKADKDPEVQDQVGEARIRIGYLAAKRKDYAGARAELTQAALETKGTGAMSADFGGIPDQAAYQAAVTLVAEGKKEDAQKAFIQFIKDRPLSPLVSAAERRLVRMNGGKPKPEWEALLQDALTKQQKHIAFETSVCGPKAIAHLLKLLGKPEKDYKEIARLCGTSDKDGTTIEGMRKGLKALGIDSFAYSLNRKDFAALPLPALVLWGQHYLVIESISAASVTAFDPSLNASSASKLPPLDDPNFSANVITLSPMSLENN